MEERPLIQRTGPRPQTFKGMPHAQVGVHPDPGVNQELHRRAFSLPGVQERPSVISVPGARALWLDDDVEVAHPEAILRGREFAHIHPDGSLHVALSPDRAPTAIDAGWAEPHPLSAPLGLPGLVMLYTPRTMEELDVVFDLVVDSYNYVTGRSFDAGVRGDRMSEYKTVVVWSRDGAAFTDNRYSRRHRWLFDGGIEVPASSSPHVVPLPLSVAEAVDPEEAFVASLSSCHMLSFLFIAAKRGFLIDSYRDEAVGELARDASGKLAMTRVMLRPEIESAGDKRPTRGELIEMHHEAHELCFIASSVRTDVRCEPVGLPDLDAF